MARKLSAYQRHMSVELKKGKTFKEAVKSWRAKHKTTKSKKVVRVKKHKRKISKKGRTIKPTRKRTGKVKSYKADRQRKALPAGKRISRTGKVYYESRKNRSDNIGTRI